MALPRAIGFACRCNNTGAVATRLTARRISPPLTSRDPRLLLVPAAAAPFTTNNALRASRKQMPSRPKPPPDSEIEESFLKGSGPGGQKINKTNSAVQLKHIPTGIVVKCQETRSRDQNRKIARNLLAQRLDILHNGDQSRWAIVGDHKKKKADSAAKKSRRKYKKLAEEKEKGTAAADSAAAPAQQDNDKGEVEAKPDIEIQNKGEPFNQQSEPPSREPEMSTKS
ncbi:RF-1 domain-containing protein [Rhypophila decipiens]|uniref:RF-1 domain-containing protein n=1 Tax=Rhypophila decipiens TaxID=261697 RepID=A0AAN6YKN1_9PEZI|nr:RF-1 domain-containing protein [Rhypophila decipiens]